MRAETLPAACRLAAAVSLTCERRRPHCRTARDQAHNWLYKSTRDHYFATWTQYRKCMIVFTVQARRAAHRHLRGCRARSLTHARRALKGLILTVWIIGFVSASSTVQRVLVSR